jgi:DNA invertase Pin-like site-specific DNA recombinase
MGEGSGCGGPRHVVEAADPLANLWPRRYAHSQRRCRSWVPAPEPYVDNDLSAYQRTVVRPAFERLLQDLEHGVIQGIVVHDFDRFTRQPRDLERAIDIYARSNDLVFASIQGDLDLLGDGKLMARIYAAVAKKASADTARRVRLKHLDLARQGVPVGGARTPPRDTTQGRPPDPSPRARPTSATRRMGIARKRPHQPR